MDDSHTENEESCREILVYIFSDYEKLITRIAPHGWDKSPFKQFRHPTAERQYEEYKTIADNIARLSKKEPGHYDKTLINFQVEFKEEESNMPEECIYIIGLAVYDIFSNNHEVISSENKVYDLGSLRSSGGFIAEFLNGFFPEFNLGYDYLDFYLGGFVLRDRADMTPFYEHIFTRLKEKNCSWKYAFPRLFMVDLRHLKKEESPEEYDPQKSVLNEIEDAKKDVAVTKLRQDLEEAYQQELEEARRNPPPPIVQAHKNIFGKLPEGFPR